MTEKLAGILLARINIADRFVNLRKSATKEMSKIQLFNLAYEQIKKEMNIKLPPTEKMFLQKEIEML